jgi:hypothetical protein
MRVIAHAAIRLVLTLVNYTRPPSALAIAYSIARMRFALARFASNRTKT